MADFTAYGGPSREWLEHENAYGPAPETPIHTLSVEQIQKMVNEGREQASAQAMEDEGLSEKVHIESMSIEARDGYIIPARIYRPAGTPTQELPIYIFFHGGGFVYGTPTTEDAACSRIASSMSIMVVNAIYRHVPQDTYPTAHNDANDSYDWVISNAKSLGGDVSKIIVGGLSAGANLAASVVLEKHRLARPKIQGLILGIPYLVMNYEKFPAEYHLSRDKGSRTQCANAPILPMEVVDFFGREFRGKYEGVLPDVGLTPERELAKFPSTTFVVAGNDPLRDDGFLFAEKMQRAGVPVKFHVFPGLPHAFRRFNDLQSSKRWDEIMIESLKWALEGPKAPTRENNPVTVVVEEATTGNIEQ